VKGRAQPSSSGSSKCPQKTRSKKYAVNESDLSGKPPNPAIPAGLPAGCWITLLGDQIPPDVMKPTWFAVIAIILVTFGITIALYPAVPDTMASHWDAAGQVNGYMAKPWGLAIIPAIMAIFAGLFALLPRIDPLRKNYAKFQRYYEGFVLLFAAYLLVIQLQVILWNTGHPVSPNLTFPVVTGILIIYVGFLIDHAEPNWFVGIRTPWTLSSETVWKKTHEAGGKLFKIAGLICLAGVLAGRYALWFVLVPVLAVAVSTVVYSYVLFQDEERKSGKPG